MAVVYGHNCGFSDLFCVMQLDSYQSTFVCGALKGISNGKVTAASGWWNDGLHDEYICEDGVPECHILLVTFTEWVMLSVQQIPPTCAT